MQSAPRVVRVQATGDAELSVCFENGVKRVYDCRPILSRPEFHLLRSPVFFRSVKVDPGGYGVSWSDDLDLSEYELWVNGTPLVDDSARPAIGRG